MFKIEIWLEGILIMSTIMRDIVEFLTKQEYDILEVDYEAGKIRININHRVLISKEEKTGGER
ncbi:MAG: hypothetical protein A2Z69_00305 [Bacteroidetes bacterium RBG_13_44_24]|nr:MAG: hypothetical protein A2Z69_00305 [Bacteroidetes bacterium RBG_13_44_24]